MRAFPASRTLPRARWHASAGVALWLALSACLPAPALAEQAHRKQQPTLPASRLQYDDLTQLDVFPGHVVLTKGATLQRAARLVIRQDPEGYQYGPATGNLAFFRQK